jgi:putative transcriptional regulator
MYTEFYGGDLLMRMWRMSLTWQQRLIVGLAALLPAYLPLGSPAAAQTPTSLAGQFLIATPSMGDPRFARTVIVMVRHDKDGALGIVINRPIAERPLADVLEMLGQKEPKVAGTIRIVSGGPVQPEVGFVIHSADYHAPGTIEINAHVAATSSRDVLLDIGNGKGPSKSLVAFGYAGWAPGQLERELETGAWATAPADPALIFDEDRDKVWDSAYSRRTRDL